jgi:cytochrome c biogenesis protein
VVRIVKKDNLTTKPQRLRKMRLKNSLMLSGTIEEGVQKAAGFLASTGWTARTREKDDGVLLFAQKGAWTRFGVYIVHLSILVILLGAVIGSPTFAKKILHKPGFAFKGSIMIPESRETNFIYSFQDGKKINLGFTVQCNFFTIEFYNNGMPKTYLSKVSVYEKGKPVILKNGTTIHDLKVNKPLTYKGITFYQSSYQPYSDFLVRVSNKSTGEKQSIIISPGKQVPSKLANISFGIINQETRGESVQRAKVWFADNEATPATFWVNNGQKAIIKRPSGEYEMTVKQLYATGLQVTKDPGVWFVYTGCGMMLLGLFIAFFMSHRKIYAFVHKEEGQTEILFAGSAHKNKVGFEKVFIGLIDAFKKQIN